MTCCTGAIRDSGVLCGTAMEATCVIDEGASSGALATVATTSIVEFAAFMDTVGASLAPLYTAFVPFPARSMVPECSGSAND